MNLSTKQKEMNAHELLVDRIISLCDDRKLSYYQLAYESGVPLTTLLHIFNGPTKNPGVFTVAKLCGGLGISMSDFFDTEEFRKIVEEVD